MAQHQPLSNKEKVNIFFPLIVAFALATGTWLGFAMKSRTNNSYVVVSDSGSNDYNASRGKFMEVMRFIEARYLEDENIGKLEEEAIKTVLDKLDPHSRFISLKQIADVKESLAGNFDGIGVEFYILEDTIYVVNVIPNGPSDQAGLKDGDKIVTINDSLVAGKEVYSKDVMDKLKGASGSKVKVGIKRRGEDDLIDYTITRGRIAKPSVEVAYMLNETTGLIKISSFSGTTYDEFISATKRLTEEEGMQNLVLDLRRNPGGYLDAAVRILDQLFDSRKLLVYTEGRNHNRKEYNSTGKSVFDINKVMVLIDEGSASASEIMAGAIQDHDRGLIIGRRSFGKGLVQEQYELSDGSALRLTVAKYFTPSGRFIQKPYDKGGDEYSEDIQDRFTSGEFYSKDSIQIEDSTEYQTFGGRVVYGGGGIIPDIFIPMDTLFKNNYYLALSTYVPSFLYHYTDVNRRSLLTRYPNFESFKNNFVITKEILEQFIAHTHKNDLESNNEAIKVCSPHISDMLKAYLSRQLYDETNHYRLLYEKDEMVRRAVSEINRTK